MMLSCTNNLLQQAVLRLILVFFRYVLVLQANKYVHKQLLN